MDTKKFEQQLKHLKKTYNLRELIATEKRQFRIVQEGICYTNLSSNDYLGLASQVELQRSFQKKYALNKQHWGASSSRLLSGTPPIAIALEGEIAKDYGKQVALLFNSGYHANIGILPALTTTKDLIIADKLVHASMIDGMRLSSARCMRYRHNDLTHLEALLQKYRSNYENVFLVTESIFSMDGDKAPLKKLVELKKNYKLSLYLDEAHAVGVVGNKGLGLAAQEGCLAEIDILVGTFGKALASVGAFVVCNQVIKKWLINTMRSFIFSTSLPPVNILWTTHMWEYGKKAQQERDSLKNLQQLLADSLGISQQNHSHIFPIPCKNAEDCLQLSAHLRTEGFFCLPIRFPTVPKGKERIRVCLQAGIPPQEIIRFSKAVNAWL